MTTRAVLSPEDALTPENTIIPPYGLPVFDDWKYDRAIGYADGVGWVDGALVATVHLTDPIASLATSYRPHWKVSSSRVVPTAGEPGHKLVAVSTCL